MNHNCCVRDQINNAEAEKLATGCADFFFFLNTLLFFLLPSWKCSKASAPTERVLRCLSGSFQHSTCPKHLCFRKEASWDSYPCEKTLGNAEGAFLQAGSKLLKTQAGELD